MAATSLAGRLATELFEVFDETFDEVHGIYLNRGTSLFETLATISAAEASVPVGNRCATIAAQVEHVRFYLDVYTAGMRGEEVGKVDWDEIWRTVSAVTPDEWMAIQARLRESYDRSLALMRSFETWEGEDDIGGALALLVHTAYHLGEIRQALCTVKA